MNRTMTCAKRVAAASLASLLCGTCAAAVVPVSPAGGETVVRLPEAQRRVMALPTQDARRALIAGDKALAGDASWRKSLPLVLKWKATEGEQGPWKVELSDREDLSGARLEWADAAADKDGVFACLVPRSNLIPGVAYYWRVTSDVKCRNWGHGRSCDCTNRPPMHVSPTASFLVDGAAPRWIRIEGRVANIRDLGGWPTVDGRRVKTGLAYRGQGLNDNSVTGDVRGRNRLTVEDVAYMRGTLGIRTDLDLRTPREVADMTESPLGAGVKFVCRSSPCYSGIFSDAGKKTMAENVREFSRRENYPIYFHCIAGADRTGALAYIINGLLGVSEHDVEVDWESTFYPKIPGKDASNSVYRLRDGLAKYGAPGDPLSRRIELYLNDCGVTDAEMAAIRQIMLGE